MTRALAAVLVIACTSVAQATESSVSITGVTLSKGRVTVTGTVAAGDAARAPVTVMSDPAGDSATTGLLPDGLDLRAGSVALAADGSLVFIIETHNMSQVLGAQAPTFVYDWNVAVDGVDAGFFLQAGFVGGFGTANTGRFFNLCRRPGPACTPLPAGSGTIGTPNDTVTIRVAPGQILAKPGAAIGVGSALGSACTGVCSTWQPVAAILYNTGGDQAEPGGYIVPGGVQLALAAAELPEEAIDWASAVRPNVQPDGTYAGTFTPQQPPIPGAAYRVIARTCSGTTEAPVCVSATSTFTA